MRESVEQAALAHMERELARAVAEGERYGGEIPTLYAALSVRAMRAELRLLNDQSALLLRALRAPR